MCTLHTCAIKKMCFKHCNLRIMTLNKVLFGNLSQDNFQCPSPVETCRKRRMFSF